MTTQNNPLAQQQFRIDHLLDSSCIIATPWLRSQEATLAACWPVAEALWWSGEHAHMRTQLTEAVRRICSQGQPDSMLASARPAADGILFTITSYGGRQGQPMHLGAFRWRRRGTINQWAAHMQARPIAAPLLRRALPLAHVQFAGKAGLRRHLIKRQLAALGVRLVEVLADRQAATDVVLADDASADAGWLHGLHATARVITMSRRQRSELGDVSARPGLQHRLWEALTRPGGRYSMPGQLVLLVVDSPAAQYASRLLLEKLGHEVVCASDGEAVLQHARDYRFDLIFTDMRLPRISGSELTQRIRTTGVNRNCRVIALTGDDDSERNIAIGAGVDQCMMKPATLAAFQRCIENPRLKFIDAAPPPAPEQLHHA